MDPAVAFFLSVRMETTVIVSAGTRGKESSFTFPLVVDSSSSSFNDFRANICAKYPWGLFDAVEIRYWDSSHESWNPLQCDDELGLMFARNAETRSCNLEITVIQRKRGERCEKTPASRTNAGGTIGRRSSRPCASRPGASSTPSAPGTSAASASTTPTAPTVSEKQEDQPDPVVEEALPDAPILSDEEDEKLYPGYVQQNNQEHAANEDYIPAEFSDTDEDERQEDHDMGAFEDADEDRPVMMYDRDNPSIEEGVVFPGAVDCRNAVGTFSIKSETEYITLKSDQSRFTVKCAYDKCKWRLHASLMRRSTLFQVLAI